MKAHLSSTYTLDDTRRLSQQDAKGMTGMKAHLSSTYTLDDTRHKLTGLRPSKDYIYRSESGTRIRAEIELHRSVLVVAPGSNRL